MVVSETRDVAHKVIGTRPIRHDGPAKVTGKAQYGADVRLPGMAHGAVLRSPHAHANIIRIDTSRAQRMPGVLAVMTGQDMPVFEGAALDVGEEGAVNIVWASSRVMAHEKALFKGHPVAAVAARDRNTAFEAIKQIDVEYEVLPPVVTLQDAIAPNAPLVHEDLVGNHLGEWVHHTNIASHFRYEFGDPEAGFELAETIVEREHELSTVHQGYIEPQAATADWDGSGRLSVWTSTQGSFGVRSQLSAVLHMAESEIQVVPMEIGGGFGGKIAVYLEPVAAILSRKCGRPVQLLMDRASVFQATGPGAAALIRVRMGVDGKGRMTAATAELRYDAGAFPGSPVQAGAVSCFAVYDLANLRIDGYDIVTTKPKTAAYRAPGSTQVTFAVESVVDEIAEKLGMDPIELRLLNASHEGGRRADGPIWGPIGTTAVLQAARASDHWNAPLERKGPGGVRRGRGIAIGFWRNAGRRSTVTINVNFDGSASLIEGSTDLGGTRVSIAMQAAEVLGIPVEDIHPRVADTDGVGYTDVTGGSRTTYATGYAAYKAAQGIIAEMCQRAARSWEVAPEDVVYHHGVFAHRSDPELRVTFKELTGRLDGTGGPVAFTGSVDLPSAGGAFGAHIADVEVDPETGKTDVLRYTVVQDVGRAIHPAYLEGQMEGGAAQGIGWALNEEYFLDEQGGMLNSSYLDYRLPTALDLPEIETVIVEVANPLHPYGVRGAGEVPISPPVGTIANTLYDALSVRFRKSPMNPGRILEALGATASSQGEA